MINLVGILGCTFSQHYSIDINKIRQIFTRFFLKVEFRLSEKFFEEPL